MYLHVQGLTLLSKPRVLRKINSKVPSPEWEKFYPSDYLIFFYNRIVTFYQRDGCLWHVAAA